MADKFLTVGNGGLPLVLDDFRYFLGQTTGGNHGIYQMLDNMLRGFGDNFIVQGVVASGTTPNIEITEGWIMLAGELLKVDAQTGIDTTTEDSFTKVITFNTAGNKEFRNGAVIDTFQQNRGVVNSLAGTLDYNGNTLSDLRTIADVSGTDTPLKTKIIEIGDWNMDSTTFIQVVHGLTLSKIRIVSVMIRNDTSGQSKPLNTNSAGPSDGAIDFIDINVVQMSRTDSGTFDGTSFDSISFNRGWINIQYVD